MAQCRQYEYRGERYDESAKPVAHQFDAKRREYGREQEQYSDRRPRIGRVECRREFRDPSRYDDHGDDHEQSHDGSHPIFVTETVEESGFHWFCYFAAKILSRAVPVNGDIYPILRVDGRGGSWCCGMFLFGLLCTEGAICATLLVLETVVSRIIRWVE